MDYIEVVKTLIQKNISIATAESITGGLISKMITDVPGSSAILKESFIVYSNEAKVSILGVEKNIIDKYGVVSKEVAREMAEKLYDKTKRNICISTTGNAGPTVCDDKPVGRVYVGIAIDGVIETYECNFDGDRNDIRCKTSDFVFNKLRKQ